MKGGASPPSESLDNRGTKSAEAVIRMSMHTPSRTKADPPAAHVPAGSNVPAAPPPPPEVQGLMAAPKRRHPVAVLVSIVLVVIIAAATTSLFVMGGGHQSTNDAYVEGR